MEKGMVKKTIELGDDIQNIILACKGYYLKSKNENCIEMFKRIISYNDNEPENMISLNYINKRLYEVYDILKSIDFIGISKTGLENFIFGKNYEIEDNIHRTFYFLRDNIRECNVIDRVDYIRYELVLNVNSDLRTEYTKIIEEKLK